MNNRRFIRIQPLLLFIIPLACCIRSCSGKQDVPTATACRGYLRPAGYRIGNESRAGNRE